MRNAVKTAALATMSKRSAAEQLANASLPEPDVAPDVVPEAPAPNKSKKPKKEKATKSKLDAPEVFEAVDTERVEDALPESPAMMPVAAVEKQRTKHKGKSGTKADSKPQEAEAEAASDVDMEEQATKPSKASESAPHVSPQTSVRPASRLLQNVRLSSPSRPPAGSDVDEVVIQVNGEGSSDESSSSSSDSDSEDEEDEEGDKGEDHDVAPDLTLLDVEALLRGPSLRKSILEELPSESEDEESDEEQSEPGDDEEEEINLDKKYRRLSKRFQREGTSSDEEPELEPDPEPAVAPEPEQELDATQEEEEQEVVAATFMDVDPQGTPEDEVRLPSVNTSLASELIRLLKADLRAPPTVVPASQVSAGDDNDVPMSAPGDGEPLATAQLSSSPPNGGQDPVRPVSPTVSMMEEEHRRDGSQDVSSQSLAQIEEQLLRTSLKSRTSNLDSTNGGETGAQAGTSGGELEDDPIEPADDLVVPESPSIDVIDPIDPDPEPDTRLVGPERYQSTPPPLPTSHPGTVRRMKNREGKLGTPSPVKASELPLAALAFSELDFDEPPSPQTQTPMKDRMTPRTSSASSMAPPPVPAPASAPTPASKVAATDPPAPKRRGRPPLPPEEKERRAAERQAKKEAEKAEKTRLRLERAAALASKKVNARQARAAAKAKPAPVVESEDENEQEKVPEGNAEKAPLTATPRPGWTTLTQTQTPQAREESLVEGESMMIDELRSSSPAHSSPREAEPARVPRTPASASMPPPSTQRKGKPLSKVGSQPETPKQADAEPLFLPSSSQVPYTPYALARPPSPPRAGDKSSGEEEDEDEEDEESTVRTRLQRARPWLREAPFRRLSDIASQAMFTPDSAFALRPPAAKDMSWSLGKNGDDKAQSDDDDDDDDDDESDEDDEDEGKKSHIPQERRAGAGLQKKRTSGLASFAK